MGKTLSVDEALQTFISSIEEYTGWKYLKSQRRLKKKVKDFEFEINFFSSQWNQSYEYIGVNADFRMVYKKLGKLPVQNNVFSIQYCPLVGDDAYWFDISTEEKLAAALEELKDRIEKKALRIVAEYEKDPIQATKNILNNEANDDHVKIEFLASILGNDAVRQRAQEYYDAKSEKIKQQVAAYKPGDRSAKWMINPTNLKYIVENGLINL